ncbi:MAG: spore cortex-lytic enzyme [Bacillota bacterium]
MSNKRTKNIVVLCLVAILIASILFSVAYAGSESAFAMTLKKGSNGESVRELQQALNEKGFWVGTPDGVFGAGTESGLKKFQSANGLSADGVAGAKTLEKLGISKSTQSGANNAGFTDSDVYLLAKTIHAEARGESYIGQVAVGAVILNRVKSPEFPNTISGVVYQPWAFTAVHDGQINLEPDEQSIRAAKDALNGWDPSYGCLFYYNPDKATSKWIFTTQTVTQIGSHIFSI